MLAFAGLEPFVVAPLLTLPLGPLPHLVEHGIAALRQVLAELPDCDAISFGNDSMAFGALTEAQRLGIDVPGRLAIAGYGGLDYTAYSIRRSPPSISAATQAESGRRSSCSNGSQAPARRGPASSCRCRWSCGGALSERVSPRSQALRADRDSSRRP